MSPWEPEGVEPTRTVRPDPAPIVVPESCPEPSLLGAARLNDAAPAPGPTIIERFDEAGCVADRQTFTYDGAGNPVEETYAFFLKKLQSHSYIQLVAFRKHITYDAQGHIIRIVKADLNTGELLYQEDTSYDAAGRKTRQIRLHHDIDLPREGASEERWSYHSSGELLTHETYYNGQQSGSDRFVRDSEGRPLKRFTASSASSMAEALAEEWKYDDASRVVVHTTQDARGAALTISSTTYRADGTLQAREEINNAQRWLNVWRYDAQGRELLYTQDSNRDGVVDYMTETVFDARGQLTLKQANYAADGRGGFLRSTRATRAFDAQGRLVEEHIEFNAVQRWATKTSWSWEQDRALRTSTYSRDGAPFIVTNRALILVDERPIWLESYNNGALTQRSDYSYDTAGRTLREAHSHGGQRSALTYTYDAAGRLVSRVTAGESFEGDPTVRSEWRYR